MSVTHRCTAGTLSLIVLFASTLLLPGCASSRTAAFVPPVHSAVEPFTTPVAVAQDDEELTDEEKGWEVSAEASFTASGGNTRKSDVDGRIDATKKWDVHEFLSFIRAEYGEAENSTTGETEENTNRQEAGAKYRYFFSKPWYAFVSQDLERDKFEDIRIRSDSFVGLGTRVYESDAHEVNAEVGAGWTYTRRKDDSEGDPSAVGREDWTWKINEDWTFKESFEIIPNLSDSDEYRTTATADLETEITDNIIFGVGAEHRYSSRPAPGVERVDWEVKLKFGVKIF